MLSACRQTRKAPQDEASSEINCLSDQKYLSFREKRHRAFCCSGSKDILPPEPEEDSQDEDAMVKRDPVVDDKPGRKQAEDRRKAAQLIQLRWRRAQKFSSKKRVDEFADRVKHAVTRIGLPAYNIFSSGSMSTPLLETWLEDKVIAAKKALWKTSTPMLRKTCKDLGEIFKATSIRDPDMWFWVRPIVTSFVGSVWDDVVVEIESVVLDKVMRRKGSDLQVEGFDRHRSRIVRAWLRLRAWVLNHYLPYNRTFFGKVKDPAYVAMTAASLLTVLGIRVFFFFTILIMLLFPGPPDEHQLVNFILIFKGTQFFTAGVGTMFMGAMEYYLCVVFAQEPSAEERQPLRRCILQRGPGSSDWVWTLMCDYLGSVALVWVAFLVLPQSTTKRQEVTRNVEDKEYCCCFRGVLHRGGKLRPLMNYDLFCWVLAASVYTIIYVGAPAENRHPLEGHDRISVIKASIVWSRVLYSLLSLPFFVFVLPFYGRVFTHSTRTGFDEKGTIRTFKFPQQEAERG